MTNTTNLVTHPISENLLKHATAFSEKLGVSLLIFFGFWLASMIVRRIISRVGPHDLAKQDILKLLGQIAKTSLLIFGAVTALGTLGVNVSALVAGLGLTGFAL